MFYFPSLDSDICEVRDNQHTMSKCNYAIQTIKDYWRVNHFIVIKLAKIFDFRDALLVEFEIVLLQAQCDRL